MDAFKFNFDFAINKGPLTDLSSQLDAIAKKLDEIEEKNKKLEESFNRFQLPDFMSAFSGLSGVLSSITSTITGLVTGAFNAAKSFAGMALDAASVRENALATFESMYQNKDVAADVFKRALQIAKDTKFETKEVVERFTGLAAAGFKSKELENVFLAISDVASARGSQQGDVAQRALSTAMLTGVATQATVNSLARAGAGDEIYLNLAKSLGIHGAGKEDTVEKVKKAITSHQVSGYMQAGAFLDAVNTKFDSGTGQLGTYSKEMGIKTIEGQFSTLKSSVMDIIAGFDVDENSGIGKFKKFLTDLNDQMSGKDENGNLNENAKRFQALIKNLVDDVFLLFDMKGGSTKDVFSNLLTIAEGLEKKFRGLMEWIRDTLLPFITDKVIPYIAGIFSDPDGFLAGIKRALLDLARLVGKELYAGVKEAIFGEDDSEDTDIVTEKGQNSDKTIRAIEEYYDRNRPESVGASDSGVLGSSYGSDASEDWVGGMSKGVEGKARKVGQKIGRNVIDGTNEATETHSPSKVFERIGMNLIDGLDMGIEKGKSRVDKSIRDLIDPLTETESKPGHANTITVGEVTIHIDGTTDPSAVANEVVRVLKDLGRYSLAPSGLVR